MKHLPVVMKNLLRNSALLLLTSACFVDAAATTNAGEALLPPEQRIGLIEDTALRTQCSKTFVADSGRRLFVAGLKPVHYRDASGAWREIDTAVVQTGDVQYPYTIAENAWEAKFRRYFDETDTLLYQQDGESVALTAAALTWVVNGRRRTFAAPRRASVQVRGNEAVYPAAYGDSLDMKFTLLPEKIQKELVVASRDTLHIPGMDATLELAFNFRYSDGLELWVGEGRWVPGNGPMNGDVRFKKNGRTIFYWQAPRYYDSANPDPVSGKRYAGDAEYTIEPSADGKSVVAVIRVPAAWLYSAQYPVYIDPTFDSQPDPTAGIDAFLASDAPNNNYGTAPEWSTTRDYRPLLIRFDLSSIPSFATILSATMTFANGIVDISTANIWDLTVWRVAPVNNNWVEGTANGAVVSGASCWNFRQHNTVNWAGSAGCATAGTDYLTPAMGSVVGISSATTWIQIPLSTAQVSAWISSNHGARLNFTNVSGGGFWIHLPLSDHADVARRPRLTIFYVADTTAPAAVSDLAATSNPGHVRLTWSAPGNNGMLDVLNGRYLIQRSTNPGTAWSTATAQIAIATSAVNPGSPQAYQVTGLPPGVTFYFRLWTQDQDNNTSDISNAAAAYAGNIPPTVSITQPANNQLFVVPATVTVAATASDPDGSLVRVLFYTNGTLISEDSSSPYGFTWANVAAGTYALVAAAQDDTMAYSTSSAVTFIVNTPPSVALSSPTDGYLVDAPAAIELRANASDTDGTIAVVRFYHGGTALIGSASASPYTYTWNTVAAGAYQLTAAATDNRGTVSTSSVVNIIVNAKPVVTITSPVDGQGFAAPANVTITASASDSDGSIASVSFYAGTTQLGGAVSASPYAYTWTGVSSGSYALTARATDNRGSVSTSAVVTIAVTVPPMVVLTTPTAGAKFGAGSDITLSAQASDPDGSVTAVRFYDGTTLLGSAGASPYTFTWMGVMPGSYVIRVEAQDNLGMTAVTTGTPISVNQGPVVSITAPTQGAMFSAPATVTITAEASDPDGSVVSVTFFQNGNLLGTDTSSPFSYVWSGVGQGNYELVAVAMDDYGDQGSASSVNISVITGPSCTIVAPADGTQVDPGSDMLIEADAQDSGGTITQVEFFINGTSVGTTPVAPYQYVWTLIPAGRHTITAQAHNDLGLISPMSSPVHIIANRPPDVTLTSPADGATFAAGDAVPLAATATDPDGSIAAVRFYVDGVQVGSATAVPYEVVWSTGGAGQYSVYATAEDDLGGISTSAVVSISVAAPNQLPVVSLTSPADGTTYTTPNTVSVPLAATATDPDGSIAAVRFYGNGTLIGTVSAAPYTYTWAGVGLGVYQLTATATDNRGGTSTSTPVTVTVASGTAPNQAPVVSMTSPQDGATYTASPVVSIMIAATATDPEGQMQKVEFYGNGTLIVSDPTPPYSHTWMNVGPGSYQLTAVAYDVQGLASTSSVVNVTVVQSTALYTIEGYVTSAAGQGITGVTVTLTGVSSGTVVTGVDGRYVFTDLASGNYMVRPVKEGWRFVPEVLNYTPLNRTWQNQNFVGEPAIASNRLQITGGVDGYINLEYGEKVVVWINPKTGGNLDVLVYDLRGRLVWQKRFTVTANDPQRLECDLAGGRSAVIPSGVYLMYLKGAGYNITKRIAAIRSRPSSMP